MSENPLLSKVKLPGRIFQLPSRGIFYTNGELDPSIVDGEIHVHPMSALAEIHIKNPDQLFSGQAVETVFKQCVTGISKPSELLSKDVDAIMMFLRTVTYGPQYEFGAKHTCENAKEHTYTVNVDQHITEMKMIDPTTLEENFTLVLPNEQVLKLRPSKYAHVIELLKNNEGKEEITYTDIQNNLMLMLGSIVQQVDDVTDTAHIKEWLATVPTTWITKIANKVEEVHGWGPQLTWKGKCKDCKEEFEVELPINPISFFTE